MNVKEIKEMINLMNENGILELEVEKEGLRLKLKRSPAGFEMNGQGQIMVEKERIVPVFASGETAKAPQALPPQSKQVEIKAPMVGTFYRSPSPESPPYSEVNQVIEPGQVICIIEAMKLMNEIKSEIKGKIIEIVVDNAEPIEFGQPMFIIEPL